MNEEIVVSGVKPQRFTDIDMAKGLAILLVVLGHVVATDYPAGNTWFEILNPSIYRFHMPFFMFLSGWVFFHTYKKNSGFKDFISKRAFRLLLPYFLMIIVVMLGKYLASTFFLVDHPINNIKTALYDIFWNTKDSSVRFVWYLYVLFIFNFISFMFLKKTTNIFLLLVVSFLMCFVYIPQIMFLNLIFFYYFFFCLGGIFYTYKEVYYSVLAKYKYELLALFITFIVLYKAHFLHINTDVPSKFIIGLLSIPALHGLIKYVIKENKFLLFIGKYSLTIYLFNVIVIGILKALMFKWHCWDGSYFLVFLPVLLTGGVFLPILSYKLVFSRIPVLNKIFK